MDTHDTKSKSGYAVITKGVTVDLGSTRVLEDVSISIPAGQIVALIGPNGSGKTTLLRTLLGLVKPQSGEIEVLGSGVPSEYLSRVGYVPQRLTLDRGFILSVREFLSLRHLRTRHWFWRECLMKDPATAGVIEEIGVGGLLDRPLAQLSGGQLQRVLIAFALLGDPELLLLDEPTANVDQPGERTFYELIEEVHKRHQLTVVLVSHDLSMVYRHSSLVFALNRKLCCSGTPERILNEASLREAYGLEVTPYHHHHDGHDHDHPH